MHSDPSYYMTVSVQLHAPASVPTEPTAVYRNTVSYVAGNSGGIRVSFTLRHLNPCKPHSRRLSELQITSDTLQAKSNTPNGEQNA
jgi:hypothetical protein